MALNTLLKMKFSKKENEEIKKAADKIINDKKEVIKQIYGLCVKFRKSKAICNVHKKYSSSVPENCSVCFGKNIISYGRRILIY